MKIIFMATGEIALPTFEWLVASEHDVIALVTQPDRPAGRSMELKPPAVKVIAERYSIPVLQPEKIGEITEDLKSLDADLHIVMAYGQFLPRRIYEMAPRGCINLHASLLPKYRGASCIQGAIANGDAQTGITIMHVVQVLDAGNIISAESIDILPQETGGELHDRLAELAPKAIESGLKTILDGEGVGDEQDEKFMTYAPKLERKDGEIDWKKSAEEIERMIRAYHPWPGTFTTYLDAKGRERRLKVFPQTEVRNELSGIPGEILEGFAIACGKGALVLDQVQPDGKKPMTVSQFAQGVTCEKLGE